MHGGGGNHDGRRRWPHPRMLDDLLAYVDKLRDLASPHEQTADRDDRDGRVDAELLEAAKAEVEALFVTIGKRVGFEEAERFFLETVKRASKMRHQVHNQVLLMFHEDLVADAKRDNARWSVRGTALYVAKMNRIATQLKEMVPPEQQHHLFLGPRHSTSVAAIDKHLRRLLAKRGKRGMDIST
jgi:hypothetical protein